MGDQSGPSRDSRARDLCDDGAEERGGEQEEEDAEHLRKSRAASLRGCLGIMIGIKGRARRTGGRSVCACWHNFSPAQDRWWQKYHLY